MAWLEHKIILRHIENLLPLHSTGMRRAIYDFHTHCHCGCDAFGRAWRNLRDSSFAPRCSKTIPKYILSVLVTARSVLLSFENSRRSRRQSPSTFFLCWSPYGLSCCVSTIRDGPEDRRLFMASFYGNNQCGMACWSKSDRSLKESKQK